MIHHSPQRFRRVHNYQYKQSEALHLFLSRLYSRPISVSDLVCFTNWSLSAWTRDIFWLALLGLPEVAADQRIGHVFLVFFGLHKGVEIHTEA